MTKRFAAAKINLALHVTGRREDGYHLLDSAVMFAADAGDHLSVAASGEMALTITGPFSEGLESDASNLVLKAAEALYKASGRTLQPCHITLEKHLPVASGIGGGSADAAAALNALLAFHELELPAAELASIALQLGADVPVCLASTACRMRGIGEEIEPWSSAPDIHAVLVNPRVAVSTAAIFKGLALQPGQSAGTGMGEMPPASQCLDWLAGCRNDLQPAACDLQPVIGEVLEVLAGLDGCRLARMSGSGATCFGLFDQAAAAAVAAEHLHNTYPGWWVAPTRLV
ncbi:MAG: 4-(cytidine 5'-diphospho)-2-C-methyl-D-erythritol kinase [Anderseniella sp.]|nr:4-(cytidine 5'-diphospho)-2-C-methyl-D-erythritol kinase [Anderseniella sp.]